MPIMSEEWIFRCWDYRDNAALSANDEHLVVIVIFVFLFVSMFVFCAVLWWCRLGNRQVIQLLTADSATMTVACCKQTLTGFSMSKYSSAGCGTDELASPFTLIAC